jgi:hypothetical protein
MISVRRKDMVEKANLSKGMHLQKSARKERTKARGGRQGGCRRKEKERLRDETADEGYITGLQGRRQAQNGKRSAGGRGALGGNLFALILYGRFVSSPPSLALVLANRSVVLTHDSQPPRVH